MLGEKQTELRRTVATWSSTLCSKKRLRSLPAIIPVTTAIFQLLGFVEGYLGENAEGPRFTYEPPHLVRFSNDSGFLLKCGASGEPTPTVSWHKNDGSKVTNVPGLLRTTGNGTIEFLPFPASSFRPDVHSTTYHCIAQNPVGVIVGRDVKVRAVVLQSYEARVYNQYVIPSNTAVFKCFVPLFIEEDITVTAWVIKQSDNNIFPALEGDGKYHMLPSGDLLVLDVGPSDVHLEFNCRYVNRLTGETFMSTRPGKIGLKNPVEPEPPKFHEATLKVKVKEGDNVVLPCVASGSPSPDVRWTKEFSPNQRDPFFTTGERIRMGPSVLLIRKAMISDSGTYWCEAVNPLGKEDLKILLEVYSPLGVQVQPKRQSVNYGNSATLTCSVSGHPIQSFSWLKDGQPLRQTGRTIFQTNGNVLVIRNAEKEDMGMYQCVAKNARDMAQNSAQLKLGDSRPQFLYWFISQTLQPGPMVSLKCVAVANPPPHISWTLDGYFLPEDDSRIIVGQYVTPHGEVISHVNISSIQPADGGTYSCRAKNREGEISHSARLNVYGPPSIRAMPDVAAVAEEVLRIHCPAAGYPLHSISWEKDFKPLPFNNRQRVLDNGTLIISKIQKEADNGTYTCVVKDKQGRSVQRNVAVTVLAPPRLNSFPPLHTLKIIGERVGLHCMISSGDPPISLTWVKDGDQVASELEGVTVRTVDAHNSLLTIERVTREHAGNYSCLAQNPVAEAKETAEIIINEPPRWIAEPKDSAAILGATLTIDCLTDGFPSPNVTWKRSLSEKAEDFSPLSSTAREIRRFSNGTLHFASVEEYHAGFYVCEASNGIGLDISKVIQVVVQRPPRFVTRVIRQRGRVGENGVLRCEPEGDLPLSFVWEKDGMPLSSLLNLPHEITESVNDKGMTSEVTFPSLRDGHTGEYKCIASNKYGVDNVVIRLAVIAVPEVPSNLRASDVTSRTVALSWDPSKNISAAASNFVVKYRRATETWDENGQQIEVQGHRKTVDIENLQPGTEYRFKIAAENEVGRSKFSLELAILTEEEPPSGPPTNASAYALSATEIYVTWSPPVDRLKNGVVLGYNVGYRLKRHGAGAPFNFTELPIARVDFNHGVKLANLEPFSSYEIVVQAFNSLGAGPMSNGILVTTREDKPSGPPRYVRCSATGSTSIKLSWEPPPREETNGIIRGYRVLSELVPDFEGRIVSSWLGTEALEIDIPDMMKYSNYSFRVLAFNKEGEGPLGQPVYCMTAEDVPGQPEGIKAIQTSTKTLLISWKPPPRPNGIIVKYDLDIRIKGRGKHAEKHTKTLPGRKTMYVLQDAAMGGRVYEFAVAASTNAGQGPLSSPSQLTLEQNVPAKLATWSTYFEAIVGASVVLDCMRFGIPNPTVTWETGFGQPLSFNDRVIAKDDGSLVISEAYRSDTGQYTCSVTNAHGSDSVTHNVLIKAPPSKPTLQLVKATTSNITIQWTVEDDGGSPVRGFLLRITKLVNDHDSAAQTSDEDETVDASSTNGSNVDKQQQTTVTKIMEISRSLRSFVIEKLYCGSEYSIRLSAWNSAGSGRRSDKVVVKTEGARPSVPDARVLFDVNSTFVVLHLDRWTTSSCPITRFSVKYKEDQWKSWSTVASEISPAFPSFTVENLRPATGYEVQIRAITEAGDAVVQHKFSTLNIMGVALAGGASVRETSDGPGFSDVRIMTPTILSILAVLVTIAAVYVFLKRRKVSEEGVEMASMKGDTYREYMLKYYTLLGKQAAERAAREEKTSDSSSAPPEYPDDIHPYATFHLDRGYESGTSKCHQSTANTSNAVVGNLVDLPPPLPPSHPQPLAHIHHHHPAMMAGGVDPSVVGTLSRLSSAAPMNRIAHRHQNRLMDEIFTDQYGYAGCPAPSSTTLMAGFRRLSGSTAVAGRLPTFDRPSPCTLDRRRFRHKRKSESARRKFKSLRGGLSDGDEDSALEDAFDSSVNDFETSGFDSNGGATDNAGDDDGDSGAGTSFKTSDSFTKIHKSELLMYGAMTGADSSAGCSLSPSSHRQLQHRFLLHQHPHVHLRQYQRQPSRSSTSSSQQYGHTSSGSGTNNTKRRAAKPPTALPINIRRDKDVDEDSPTHRLRLYNLGLEPGLPIPVRPCALLAGSGAVGESRLSPVCQDQFPHNEIGLGTPATVLCHLGSSRIRPSREPKRPPLPGEPSKIRSPEIFSDEFDTKTPSSQQQPFLDLQPSSRRSTAAPQAASMTVSATPVGAASGNKYAGGRNQHQLGYKDVSQGLEIS